MRRQSPGVRVSFSPAGDVPHHLREQLVETPLLPAGTGIGLD